MIKTLKTLWKGDIPLAKTYWLYGFIALGAINVFFVFFLPYLIQQTFLSGKLFYLVICCLLACLAIGYNFVVVVAVWRSAERYQGQPKWSTLARFFVLVGFIRSIQGFFKFLGF